MIGPDHSMRQMKDSKQMRTGFDFGAILAENVVNLLLDAELKRNPAEMETSS